MIIPESFKIFKSKICFCSTEPFPYRIGYRDRSGNTPNMSYVSSPAFAVQFSVFKSFLAYPKTKTKDFWRQKICTFKNTILERILYDCVITWMSKKISSRTMQNHCLLFFFNVHNNLRNLIIFFLVFFRSSGNHPDSDASDSPINGKYITSQKHSHKTLSSTETLIKSHRCPDEIEWYLFKWWSGGFLKK